jgi:predicted kinase
VIISLRGTSGAGKSHIVHSLTRGLDVAQTLEKAGRRKPLGTVYFLPLGGFLMVPGHYQIANGGVDTLRTLDEAYELIREWDERGCHVLYEGKNMSDRAARALELHREKRDVRVIVINHPVNECVAAVRARGHQISVSSIASTARRVEKDASAMLREKMHVQQLPRALAEKEVRQWLGL